MNDIIQRLSHCEVTYDAEGIKNYLAKFDFFDTSQLYSKCIFKRKKSVQFSI